MNYSTVNEISNSSCRSILGQRIKNVNDLMPNSLDNNDSFVRLKIKINTLLWEELPAKTTLARAEQIACNIMTEIIDEQNKQ